MLSPQPVQRLRKASSRAAALRLSMPWPPLSKIKLEHEDEKIGVNIVRKALEFPMRKIAENAGKEGSVIVETVRKEQIAQKNPRLGYDVLSETYGDMVKNGRHRSRQGHPRRA